MKKILSALFFATIFSACSRLPFNTPYIKTTKIYSLNNAPVIGKTFVNQNIKLGGFSSIHFLEKRDNAFYFYAITSRGPTTKSNNNELVFVLPDFNPKILILKTDENDQEIKISSEVELRNGNKKITGLPLNRLEENPIDILGLFYSIDPNGLDIKAITTDLEGGWWLADQYAPSLVQINEEGYLMQKLVANAGLPRMYGNKISQQGFSALTRIGARLFAFIPDFENKELIRILEASAESMRASAEFFYQTDLEQNQITAASAIDSNKILVLEKSNDENFRKIFLIEINKSEEIVKKHLLLDLNLTSIKDIKNVNALTIIDMKTLALMTDNNFQIDGQTDLATGLTPMNEKLSQLIIFGFEKKIIK